MLINVFCELPHAQLTHSSFLAHNILFYLCFWPMYVMEIYMLLIKENSEKEKPIWPIRQLQKFVSRDIKRQKLEI